MQPAQHKGVLEPKESISMPYPSSLIHAHYAEWHDAHSPYRLTYPPPVPGRVTHAPCASRHPIGRTGAWAPPTGGPGRGVGECSSECRGVCPKLLEDHARASE